MKSIFVLIVLVFIASCSTVPVSYDSKRLASTGSCSDGSVSIQTIGESVSLQIKDIDRSLNAPYIICIYVDTEVCEIPIPKYVDRLTIKGRVNGNYENINIYLYGNCAVFCRENKQPFWGDIKITGINVSYICGGEYRFYDIDTKL